MCRVQYVINTTPIQSNLPDDSCTITLPTHIRDAYIETEQQLIDYYIRVSDFYEVTITKQTFVGGEKKERVILDL